MKTAARRSFYGLNAANFFQAEMLGVILPVMNVFLNQSWTDGDAHGPCRR
jgi:hypothetical protein